MEKAQNFYTVEGLLEIVGETPKDRGIHCQTVAVNGDAWNMFASFTPEIKGTDFSVLTLSHPQLLFLHQKFDIQQLEHYQKNLNEFILQEPTGEKRNLMCDLNVFFLLTIEKLKQLK